MSEEDVTKANAWVASLLQGQYRHLRDRTQRVRDRCQSPGARVAAALWLALEEGLISEEDIERQFSKNVVTRARSLLRDGDDAVAKDPTSKEVRIADLQDRVIHGKKEAEKRDAITRLDALNRIRSQPMGEDIKQEV